MGLLQRFWRVFRANFTDLSEKTEDIEVLLDDILFQMQQELISIRQAIAGAIASEKRTQRHYLEHQEQAHSWYNRVQLALSQNNKDLAESALSRCYYDLEIAQNLQKQINQQQKIIEKLKQQLATAETKMKELKTKEEGKCLNKTKENLSFASDFSEIKVDIEAQLRQIRSELDNLN